MPFVVHGDVDLLAEALQLIDRRRPVDVASDEHRVSALLAKVDRQLGGVRRLAGTLQADHHQDLRRPVRSAERLALGAEDADQLFVDDADHRLGRRQRLQHVLTDGPLANGGDEVLDDPEVDVRLEQRPANLSHRVVDICLGQATFAREPAERFCQSIGEGIKHLSQSWT